jgi:hypothetical protein
MRPVVVASRFVRSCPERITGRRIASVIAA